MTSMHDSSCATRLGKGCTCGVHGYAMPTERLETRPSYPFAGPRAPAVDLSDGAQLGHVYSLPYMSSLAPTPGHAVLARIKQDEPVFVLRGQDLLAPTIVRMWCELQAHNPTCPPEKVREAREIALAMERYPNRKYPD